MPLIPNLGGNCSYLWRLLFLELFFFFFFFFLGGDRLWEGDLVGWNKLYLRVPYTFFTYTFRQKLTVSSSSQTFSSSSFWVEGRLLHLRRDWKQKAHLWFNWFLFLGIKQFSPDSCIFRSTRSDFFLRKKIFISTSFLCCWHFSSVWAPSLGW